MPLETCYHVSCSRFLLDHISYVTRLVCDTVCCHPPFEACDEARYRVSYRLALICVLYVWSIPCARVSTALYVCSTLCSCIHCTVSVLLHRLHSTFALLCALAYTALYLCSCIDCTLRVLYSVCSAIDCDLRELYSVCYTCSLIYVL